MRRLMFYSVVCLLLGTISTLISAWICGAWIPVWEVDLIAHGVTAERGRAWRIAIYKRSGAEIVRGKAIWDVALYRHGQYANPQRVLDPAVYEPFQELRKAPDPTRPLEWHYIASARGWPFTALSGEVAYSQANTQESRQRPNRLVPLGAVDLQRTVTSNRIVDDEVVVPLTAPVWSGIVLDTALFATAWAIALSVCVPVWRVLGVKRVARRAVVGIGLGALTTVAVAWAFAIWADVEGGRTWVEVYRAQSAGGPLIYVRQAAVVGAVRLRQQNQPLGPELWSKLTPEPMTIRRGFMNVKIVDGRGWPFSSLRCEFDVLIDKRTGRGTIERIDHGFALQRPTQPVQLRDFQVLPWSPIGVGFVADMVFYAVAWFGLLILGAVPMWVRSVRRRRRGECEHCGYDLRGSSGGGGRCPECGTASPAG